MVLGLCPFFVGDEFEIAQVLCAGGMAQWLTCASEHKLPRPQTAAQNLRYWG